MTLTPAGCDRHLELVELLALPKSITERWKKIIIWILSPREPTINMFPDAR